MFNSYTIKQALESLGACKELLANICSKGSDSFETEEANVLNQCISKLFILMNDMDMELNATPVYCALVKGQSKLHSQKAKNNMGFHDDPDHKKDLFNAISYIDEAIDLLKKSVAE